jgi:hypothetical protein
MRTSIQQFQIDQPFILEDGSVNPDALGGTGVVRAEGAYPNSIGFNSITPDKNDYTFVENLEVRGGVLIHDRATGTTRQIGQGNNEEYVDGSGNYLLNNGTTSGGYQRAWQLMTNSDHWIGYGQSGGGNGTCMRVESNRFDVWVTNQLGTLWTNSNTNTGGATDCAGISTKNSFVNGGTYSNSVILGGTGVSIDKSNYAFMQNAEIQGGVLRHDRATGTTRQIGQGNVVEQVAASSYYLIDTNNGNFTNSWLELINSSQSAIGYNTSNITVLNGRINLELDYSTGGVGTKDVELVDVARTTTNNDKGVISLCSRNSVLNGNVRTNVAVLGGVGITVDKDDYAYAQNLEVQGGIAAYTVDPTTNGAWGARSIPDRQYVDDSVGGLQSAADWSGITNVSTDRAYDANSTTINELADALGTLVADLRAVGILS